MFNKKIYLYDLIEDKSYLLKNKKIKEVPFKNIKHPFLVVVPEKYFFYYDLDIKGKNDKDIKKACLIKVKHLFPNVDKNIKIINKKNICSVIIAHPELSDFLEQKKDIIKKSSGLTTWKIINYTLKNRIHSFFSKVNLFNNIKLDFFYNISPEQNKKYIFPYCYVLLILFFFVLGSFVHLKKIDKEYNVSEQKLHNLYTKLLGKDYGNDPYGLLLYYTEQQKKGTGIDFFYILNLFEKLPFEGVELNELSIDSKKGIIKGKIDTYDKADKIISELQINSKYSFSLIDVYNNDEEIFFNIEIKKS